MNCIGEDPALQARLNPLGESSEVAYALKLIVWKFDLEMLLDARQEIERLQAVNTKLLEKIIVGAQLLTRDFEVLGSQAQNFLGCSLKRAHFPLSCHNSQSSDSGLKLPCSGVAAECLLFPWPNGGAHRALRTKPAGSSEQSLGGTKEPGQAYRGVGRFSALLKNDIINARCGDLQSVVQSASGNP
jgi:hypothetical protein